MRQIAAATWVAATMLCSTASAAADDAQASIEWRLAFGADQVSAGYGLSLGLGGEAPADAPQLVTIDVSETTALARFAGMPLAARDFRLAQDELAAGDAVAPESAPWYSRRWVWWTLGGLAATAAAASGSGTAIDINENNGQSTASEARCIGPSGNVGENDLPCQESETAGCVGDICATCEDGDIISTCDGFLARRTSVHEERSVERQRWLDAGTGFMGDLIAR